MNIFDNWLFQSLVSNLVWILILAIVKWFRNRPKQEFAKPINNTEYSKTLVKNQFNICFYLSSFLTIILAVLLANNLQFKYQFLFVFTIVILFLCYVLMLGAFEAAFKYMPDDKFNKKK